MRISKGQLKALNTIHEGLDQVGLEVMPMEGGSVGYVGLAVLTELPEGRVNLQLDGNGVVVRVSAMAKGNNTINVGERIEGLKAEIAMLERATSLGNLLYGGGVRP